MKAMPVYIKTDNREMTALLMSNIAGIHRELGNYKRAVHYLEQALAMVEENDIPRAKMKAYHEAAGVNMFMEGGDIDKAFEYEQAVVELGRRYEMKGYEYVGNHALAIIYARNYLDYSKAEERLEECLRLAESFDDPSFLSGAYSLLSSVYREQERWTECDLSASDSWAIDSVSYESAMNTAMNIVIANIHLGNKEKAFRFLKEHNVLWRRFIDTESRRVIADVEAKYETEKKELRIASLEKENQLVLWLSVAGAVVLLFAIISLLYRHRLSVQKRKTAEQHVHRLQQEKQLVATQALLDGETAERSRLARDLHDGLGGMLSVVKLNLKDVKTHSQEDDRPGMARLDRAMEMLDSTISELRRVAHHMMPESLIRYGLRVSLEDFCRVIPGANFQYYGEDTRLDGRLEVLIYRCAYELVNNAVKHAEASAINMQLMIDSGIVSLTVQDNGVGFDPRSVGYGSGLENIRKRISIYNGKLTLVASPGAGTEVTIEIEQP